VGGLAGTGVARGGRDLAERCAEGSWTQEPGGVPDGSRGIQPGWTAWTSYTGRCKSGRMPANARPRKRCSCARSREQRTERPPIGMCGSAGREGGGGYLPEYHRVRRPGGMVWGLCNSPEHAVEVTCSRSDASRLRCRHVFADLPQVAAALGQTLEYRAGEGPVLTPPCARRRDIALWRFPPPRGAGPVYETVRQLNRDMPPESRADRLCGQRRGHRHLHGRGSGGRRVEHAAVKQGPLSDPRGSAPDPDMLYDAVTRSLSDRSRRARKRSSCSRVGRDTPGRLLRAL